MDRVTERLSIARSDLEALKEAVGRNDLTELERDGAIQRFEFTYETVWKAAQAYLSGFEKVDVSSPRGIARASFKAGLLSEEDARKLLQMADDRNFTVHTYNEALAQMIYKRLAGHAKMMEKWLNTM